MKKAKKKTAAKKKAPAKKTSAKKAVAKAKKSVGKKAPAKKTAKKPAKKAAKKVTTEKSSAQAPKKTAPKKAAAAKAVQAAEASVMLQVGSPAPDFSVSTDEGQVVSLQDFAGHTVVLYFYPKDDTPGCTIEACDFRDNFMRLKSKRAVVLGVSRDSQDSHRKFKNKYELPFQLLVDSDGKLCEAYGAWKEKSMYGRKYMGIERMTVLIGPDGLIQKVYPKVQVKGHVDQVLADIG